MSWADLVKKSEETQLTKEDTTIPYGWVLRYYGKDGKMHEDSNCPDEPEIDLDKRVFNAITKMRKRWELHHLLAGTYESYEVQDDLEDYGPLPNDESSSSSEDEEQNEQLAGGGKRYMDE